MMAVVPNCSFFSDAAAADLGGKDTPVRTIHRDELTASELLDPTS
jgi:hypothetical protein